MAQVLLTVSGVIAPDTAERVARGERPRADYLELARAFGADLIDYPTARQAAGRRGRLLERLGGPSLLLAWACFLRRDRYRVIVTDSEAVGLPLALFEQLFGLGRPRPRHVMIAHVLSVAKKMALIDRFGLHRQIDRFLCYATSQKRFIEQRWRVAPERVIWTPFMVDTQFFAPERAQPTPTARPMVCAVGLERRDYPTLLRAVGELPAEVVIAAASPWARQPDTTAGQPIPSNVTVRRFSQYELRQLYADSRFLVMPLFDVDFQAGVTALLEAMAMGKAVICSRTPGQTDVVVDGETGLYVPPGDPQALREAIAHLLAHPEEAERMGQAGRRRVERLMSLDHYATRLAGVVEEVSRSAPHGAKAVSS